jgi:hypothetical protein
MKSPLIIDPSSGRVSDGRGVVIFDPDIGPTFELRPNHVRWLFRGTTEDGADVVLSYVENGGYLRIDADRSKSGTSSWEWTEQNERALVAWLGEFLKGCGTPVGSYAWGKVSAVYDAKGVEGFATISYV